MQIKYLPPSSSRPPSLLQKTGAVVATAAVAGVALMFSAVMLTAVAGIGAAMFAYMWWKTRGLRRQLREQMKDFPAAEANVEREAFRDDGYKGTVIEGEATRVDEPGERARR